MLSAERVTKSFGHRRVLKDVSFSVEAGRSLAVVGPSGSGKTTLLAILGLLDRPTSGRVLIDGAAADRSGGLDENTIRREKIGFVFQDFNLVPHITVRANLQLALRRDDVHVAEELLDRLGIAQFLNVKPTRLSAGEQQRVAIVRALAKRPSVVLADEPTASLDADTRDDVLTNLRAAVEEGAAVVVVTHDPAVAEWADTTLRLDAATGSLVPGDPR